MCIIFGSVKVQNSKWPLILNYWNLPVCKNVGPVQTIKYDECKEKYCCRTGSEKVEGNT